MNPRKNALTQQRRGAQLIPGQQTVNPQLRGRPSVVQPKMTVASQMKKQPVAPPAYRPQPVPKVLQAKRTETMKVSQPSTQAGQPHRVPVAPPAYRPQPAPRVLQRQTATPPPPSVTNQDRPAPVAPAVYRPQPTPHVLQAKKATTTNNSSNVKALMPGAVPSPKLQSDARVLQRQQQRVGPTTKTIQPSQLPGAMRSAMISQQMAKAMVVQRKASPTVQAHGQRFGNVIQRAHYKKATGFSAMDLQEDNFSQTTAMLYISPSGDRDDWECHGKFTSDDGGHAEDYILGYLSEEVNYMGDALVIIEITKSPCGPSDNNCAKNLMDFIKHTAEDRGIEKVWIKAIGYYMGSQESVQSGDEIMSTSGMNFEIWDVKTEMQHGGPPEGYDNSDTLRTMANAYLYQQPKGGRKLDVFEKSQFNQEKMGKFYQ